ncbi:MAG TPA: hypothetical protein VMG12_17335, partial [Polyangiaceae bacterium]|nr:hypothetical protein [Polyangiaceae bacterium]
HAGGLDEVRGPAPRPEVHVQRAELEAALSGEDGTVFADELCRANEWRLFDGEYSLAPGVRALSSPGHTRGHMSLYIEPERGKPVIVCGDAADLRENIEDEVAPGLCWRDAADEAIASIRRLKGLAKESGASLWPNHDLEFYRSLPARVVLG